jgi:N-acetyl-anhydromuramyl-L-alanine amidase AmpD
MRYIDKIVLHCSDSDVPTHDNVQTIKEWHLARGFSDIGYHFYIDKRGKIHIGRPIEKSGAHLKGKNKTSVGICNGGKFNFTNRQLTATIKLVRMLKQFLPDASVHGHCEFSKKTCPNYDYKTLIIDKL